MIRKAIADVYRWDVINHCSQVDAVGDKGLIFDLVSLSDEFLFSGVALDLGTNDIIFYFPNYFV